MVMPSLTSCHFYWIKDHRIYHKTTKQTEMELFLRNGVVVKAQLFAMVISFGE